MLHIRITPFLFGSHHCGNRTMVVRYMEGLGGHVDKERGSNCQAYVRSFAFLVVCVVCTLNNEVVYNVQASLDTIQNYLKAQTQLWTSTLD